MSAPAISVAEPAIRLAAGEQIEWDREADVVVIGFGGAGACAALEAQAQGAEVLILDRFDGGGATAYSGGIIYAGGTSVQAREGVRDDADTMQRYLESELGDAISPEALRRFCQGSRGDIDWLAGLGMPFTGQVFTDKAHYPPYSSSLYYSGNEKQYKQATGTPAAPRGHRAIGTGFTGYVFFDVLRKAVERAAIPVLTHSPAKRLILDADGAVVGVEIAPVAPSAADEHRRLYQSVTPHKPLRPAEQDRAISACRALEQSNEAPRIRIRARRGVVIAAGGYVFNLEKLREAQPFLAAHHHAVVRLGSIGDDGSGIELGQSAAGAVGMLDNVFLNRSIAPPDALIKGIAVNAHGERFLNEDAYTGNLGLAIARQPEGRAWLIMDRKHMRHAIWQCLSARRAEFKTIYAPTLLNIAGGGTRVGASIKGLARRIHVAPEALAASVAAYNDAARAGHDPLGKLAEHLQPIQGGPYFAVNLSVTNRLSFSKMFTLSGLRVDEESGAVLGDDGRPVTGLFAAGRSAVGLCSVGYISGMSLADGVFSGRRAGRHAAMPDRT
ncbi:MULTISPECIES: FAD-binding protein [unclassified Sphingobium]|uniref:FAD-binding protein n=1 Tax=unclassified Sphingobium TaxID=2611147 RepID=UPI00119B0353|nr:MULTISPECIES: FAD-binding protein [unclassified Sphingobium]MBG6119954.1 3-oxo-5alpha-steroid 4-dehydrogenase [Sphingobium sp. JAI105]TWC99607.1 3-oxo-5alpha-steroid 4-dehydrogenase [Sphingobium sp. AEW010]TWD18956.1 3-oxo-5alpha-steroid 4-dehydrogenase [Sphingobium sp. AEW013]TWD21827.1 3-oxo-5alpha-steroid 4-dehydrogenase [Sphingobium sp. AEW001]